MIELRFIFFYVFLVTDKILTLHGLYYILANLVKSTL